MVGEGRGEHGGGGVQGRAALEVGRVCAGGRGEGDGCRAEGERRVGGQQGGAPEETFAGAVVVGGGVRGVGEVGAEDLWRFVSGSRVEFSGYWNRPQRERMAVRDGKGSGKEGAWINIHRHLRLGRQARTRSPDCGTRRISGRVLPGWCRLARRCRPASSR